MSRSKSALLGSISSQAYMIISMLLSIIITPLILKFLNKEEYGLYAVLFQFIGYLLMLDFGLGAAMARYLSSSRGEDESSQLATNRIISTSFFAFSSLGFLVIIITIFGAPYFPRFFDIEPNLVDVTSKIVLTMGLVIALQFPLHVFTSIFYAHQRQFLSHTVGFILNLVNLILPVIFLYFNFGLWAFVFTNILSFLISALVTYFLIKKYYPHLKIKFTFFDKNLLAEMYGFGFFIFLNSIAVQIVFFTDRFFIGSLVSLSAVTMFALTAKAPELCRELIFKITDNTYPAMVEIHSTRDTDKFKIIHQKLLIISTCLATIVFWLILILNKSFLKLWVGPTYFAGENILILILAAMVIHIILHVSVSCLNGAGLVKGFSISSIIEAAINLALTITLGKVYGVAGILIATLTATILTSAWYTPYLTMKHLKIRLTEYLIEGILVPMACISILGFILYYLSSKYITFTSINWLTFILSGAILLFLLSIFTWLIFLKKHFKEYIPTQWRKNFLAS